MSKIMKIWDSADGSATPGRTFTASINQENIEKQGNELSFLRLGVKGAVSTAAVVIEDFADLINPLTIRYGGDNRIVLTLQELCALSAFYYGHFPAIGENTDATGTDFLGDVKVPLYQKVEAGKSLTISADRSAVTNIATETVAITGYWDMQDGHTKPIHCVRVAHTTAATAGLEEIGSQVVPKGKMVGLIISEPNGFTDGNIDTSVQKVKIKEEGETIAEFNDLADAMNLGNVDYVTPSPLADLLRPYRAFDLRPLGIDTKAKKITLSLDVQDVSDAVVMIPVIEMD